MTDAAPTKLPQADPDLLAEICDAVTDLIIILSADARLVHWNKAWSSALGYHPEELRGHRISDFVVSSSASRWEEMLKRVIAGEEVDLEAQLIQKGGSAITVKGKCYGKSEGGALRCICGVFCDITSRSCTEVECEVTMKKERTSRIAAEVAHEQLATILERVTDGFVALDSNSHYIYVNQKAGELLARDPEKMLGRHIWTEFPEGVGLPIYKACLRAVTEQRPVEIEDYYAPLDRWFENRIFPSPNGLSIYFHDVTARKKTEVALRKSEARFRRLAESGMIGIVICRINGDILEANDAFLEMIGYSRLDLEAGTVRWRDMTPPEYDPVDDQAILELKQCGVSSLFEKEFIRKDGNRISVLVGVALIDGGLPDECISFVLDITEHRKASAQLAATAEELRALATRLQSLREEERTRVARELHDEFGSSLTALKMNIVAIDRRLSRSEPTEQVASLRARIDETLREVNALGVNVRRICSELRPGVLDQLGIAHAIEWQATEFQARSGIHCTVRRPDVVQLHEQCAIALFRIFQELLTNIARHAAASEVHVLLSEEDGCITLTVADNGRGMSTKPQPSEGGLGLLGMRERALAVGGAVSFSTPATGGTTVTVRLPAAPEIPLDRSVQ